jgi:hypothetical protein
MGALQLRRRDVTMLELQSRLLAATGDVDRLARTLGEGASPFPRRVNADPESVERGLAQLVLTLVELLRQLMERQALRLMEQGSLDDEEVERLGLTFMRLAERMDELKAEFELSDEDLNLDLGPLGSLL